MLKSIVFVLGFYMHLFAQAEEIEQEPSRFVSLTCELSVNDDRMIISADITTNATLTSDSEGVVEFSEKKNSKRTFNVTAGKVAECIFPSGISIRLKAGQDQAQGYGMCGADPDFYYSIWVNKRKIESADVIAGRCKEVTGSNIFRFTMYSPDGLNMKKCRVPLPNKNDGEVCINLPNIYNYSIDRNEYPTSKARVVRENSFDVISGVDKKICTSVAAELAKSWSYAEPNYTNQYENLPTELNVAEVSEYDFDGDGNLDRIFQKNYINTYQDGSVIAVQLGSSHRKVVVDSNIVSEKTWLLPCQFDKNQYSINECPPFSQHADEAGLVVSSPNGDVKFRGRYTRLKQFYYAHSIYLLAEKSATTYAVIKPRPNKQFESVCLIQKEVENF